MKKELRFSFLGIFTIWDYEYGLRKYKLFGITIAKKWAFNSSFNSHNKFWKIEK